MRTAVSADNRSGLLNANDTAVLETPASRATSTIDGIPLRPVALMQISTQIERFTRDGSLSFTGGVVKFDETGRVIEALGDLSGRSHPMVTSMREHKGWLYVGGILNNRIGRYRIPGADPKWTGFESYWGPKA